MISPKFNKNFLNKFITNKDEKKDSDQLKGMF